MKDLNSNTRKSQRISRLLNHPLNGIVKNPHAEALELPKECTELREMLEQEARIVKVLKTCKYAIACYRRGKMIARVLSASETLGYALLMALIVAPNGTDGFRNIPLTEPICPEVRDIVVADKIP